MTKIGYIYKLCINDGSLDECYVGSTSRIRARRSLHRCICNNPSNDHYNYFVYQFIREHGGFDNWNLHCLEEVKYDTKIELLKRERHWIEQLKPVLNKNIPTRTIQEWRKDNVETIKEQTKQYRQDNAEKIKDRDKQYRQDNAEKIKQHYQDNAEKIKEQKKQYRQDNAEKIKQQKSQKNDCVCGGKYTQGNKSTHERTRKHLDYISGLNV